ncbi:glycogen synthase GlgA [Solimonas soli]|uniref:glycogen synthase GlgA n=1 Tax=Solimonas soli TaxID=413479 RepID=UPI00068688F0|nr:glycogen synthase GlgA [Solimonas soli]
MSVSSLAAARHSRALPEREPIRLLFVAAEIQPLAKTGGLADVCGALPQALHEAGEDVRLLMPAYPGALAQLADAQTDIALPGLLPGVDARLLRGRLPGTAIPVWLLDCPALYARDGSLYADAGGTEWSDNAQRFAALSHAAVRLAMGDNAEQWRPQVVHAHDWHTGLVPLLLHFAPEPRPATIFTIHNAAFHGCIALPTARELGVPEAALGCDGAEFYGRCSLLKAGARYADRLTTVSPTYAREIQTPAFGAGLHGLYAARGAALVGIMNGIDERVWNPAVDPHLAAPYSAADREGKRACKRQLQAELGLRQDADAPLAAFASRLTTQKMADTLLHELPALLERHPRLQFALLGRGDAELERGFRALAAEHPRRLAVCIGYREAQAHRLHAGADLLLHGSRFEPCGLVQLYAMRYGAIPVVSRVGGLADSVVDHHGASAAQGTGFVFDRAHGADFAAAVHRGLGVYAARCGAWDALQERAMRRDSGWRNSARQYQTLYREARAPVRVA